MNSYPSFNSIERLENIYCVITEKIDGTNGLIEIHDSTIDGVKFGSRNRYITFENDNNGFANFFRHYTNQLFSLPNVIEEEPEYPIRIYGEWFGCGIQRGYDLKDKFFMPFSTFYAEKLIEHQIPNIIKPSIMYTGKFSQEVVDTCMQILTNGSLVIPEFKRPEGIVIHFPKYNFRLKQTFEGSKWKQNISKTEHDKKPKLQKENNGQCHACGKRLYAVKDGSGILKCMNIYCKESPNYKEHSVYHVMCNRDSDTLYLSE